MEKTNSRWTGTVSRSRELRSRSANVASQSVLVQFAVFFDRDSIHSTTYGSRISSSSFWTNKDPNSPSTTRPSSWTQWSFQYLQPLQRTHFTQRIKWWKQRHWVPFKSFSFLTLFFLILQRWRGERKRRENGRKQSSSIG